MRDTWFIAGVHSIPAIHTTHKHIEQFQPQCETLRASWLYASGQSKPHYQVPAIRIDVEIFPDRVLMWEKNIDWSFLHRWYGDQDVIRHYQN